MPNNQSTKTIDGFSVKELGEAFYKLCIIEGVTRSDIAEYTNINIDSLHGFITGRPIAREKVDAFIKALDESTTLNVKNPSDIIKRANEFPEIPTRSELAKIFAAIIKEKGISTRAFKQKKKDLLPGKFCDPGKDYEPDYWRAKALGYASLGDMLIKEAETVAKICNASSELCIDATTQASSKTIKPTDKPSDSNPEPSDAEFDNSAIKLIHAFKMPLDDLASNCDMKRNAFAMQVSRGSFSGVTRDKLPSAMATYGDYDTKDKVIKAAADLEPMPVDEMLYRASVTKLLNGRILNDVARQFPSIASDVITRIHMPFRPISEANLRKLPAVVGCKTMAEVIEKAAVTQEELEHYKAKGKNNKGDEAAQDLPINSHELVAMPMEQVARHAQRQ